MSEAENDFITTVSDAFNIEGTEFNLIKDYVVNENFYKSNSTNVLIAENKSSIANKKVKHLQSEFLSGQFCFLHIPSSDIYLVRLKGQDELYLNGLLINENQIYLFPNGSSIRGQKISPIYYSDIVGKFLSDIAETKISFQVKNLQYQFKNGKMGLQDINLREGSGRLIGFMGASGAGKTTLLNVLSGINTPTEGTVAINEIDINVDSRKIEGVIGYIAQDDLLINELTVYQNIYYNAKLCFGNLNEKEIDELVIKILDDLGLSETKDIIVGSPLNKKISGGQRKRVNIALELIREPSVLFVDEPTSGLSSRDSENIMDLLKELSLKGKLIFVVIHQPSSDIFKMFDKLMILDVGGYPVYYGNPVEAVTYFRTRANHIHASKAECTECGNVNVEQIFNIIEAKVVDEYGNFTDKRKITPVQWNEFYKENGTLPKAPPVKEVPKGTLKLPSRLKQLKVFILRDVLAKLGNTQYMLINTLEAPLLAFILAFLVKFYAIDESLATSVYTFADNENLTAYLFMSVVVALFMGMTVSAEEIIKDRTILKRESFLNLSRSSYLVSKVIILFVISGFQMLTYAAIGNFILEIRDMTISFWLVLFATSFFANMLGLNISASFNSAVTIYILIPILLIPQLLLSGAIVKFDKLNPLIASNTHVPLTGDIMASRWAFEALAVDLFKNNKYEAPLYEYDKKMSMADFRKNYLIPKLKAKVDFCDNNYQSTDELTTEEVKNTLALLSNEIEMENANQRVIKFNLIDKLNSSDFNHNIADSIKSYLDKIRKYYVKSYNSTNKAKDKYISSMQKTPEQKQKLLALKKNYYNEDIATMVKNSRDDKRIIEIEGRFVQKIDPIFLDPDPFKRNKIDFRAQLFSPTKRFLGKLFDTYWFNIIILCVFSLILYITLYFDLFKKTLDLFDDLTERIKNRLSPQQE